MLWILYAVAVLFGFVPWLIGCSTLVIVIGAALSDLRAKGGE